MEISFCEISFHEHNLEQQANTNCIKFYSHVEIYYGCSTNRLAQPSKDHALIEYQREIAA